MKKKTEGKSDVVKIDIFIELKKHLVIVKIASNMCLYQLILSNWRMKLLYIFSGALYTVPKFKICAVL